MSTKTDRNSWRLAAYLAAAMAVLLAVYTFSVGPAVYLNVKMNNRPQWAWDIARICYKPLSRACGWGPQEEWFRAYITWWDSLAR
jgi:hypothetical protein